MKIKRGQLVFKRSKRIKLVLLFVLIILAWRIGTMVKVVKHGEDRIKNTKNYCSKYDGGL